MSPLVPTISNIMDIIIYLGRALDQRMTQAEIQGIPGRHREEEKRGIQRKKKREKKTGRRKQVLTVTTGNTPLLIALLSCMGLPSAVQLNYG